MRKVKKLLNLGIGILGLAILANFSSIESQVSLVENQLEISENSISVTPSGKGYNVLCYYNDCGLVGNIAGTYAAATQGFLWGMVLGPVGGAAVGLAVGI